MAGPKLAAHAIRAGLVDEYHLLVVPTMLGQFLLGHVSIQTTERYFGCKQKVRDAVYDRVGIEPEANR